LVELGVEFRKKAPVKPFGKDGAVGAAPGKAHGDALADAAVAPVTRATRPERSNRAGAFKLIAASFMMVTFFSSGGKGCAR
tara:strand:- start:31 stop:273 length:243 start_codon:yes stop_codon:yes gene_type:complete